MANFDITNPIFHNEDKAREYLEAQRWPDGPYCPHCGVVENIKKLQGKSHRKGLYQCNSCRGHFTVTVGTLYERSKIPLHKWLLATHLMCASKKGISAHQLHRMLGITYKSAWFMAHRIREAMREPNAGPMGGEGKSVEVDETYIGGRQRGKNAKGRKHGQHDKEAVVSLLERGGKVRSIHVAKVNSATLKPIMRTQLHRTTDLKTDEAMYYKSVGKEFASHKTVNHSIHEYVRGEDHTNTIEGYFSIMKRGINGVYQHVSATHLKRYLGEFDFRYNNRDIDDFERANKALKGISGKRLTYRRPGSRQELNA